MPSLPASRSTASAKVRWSIFWMKEMTSPPSPHPKQCQAPTAGRMLKEGLFSSWKGHSPFIEPGPADRRVTSSRDERSLTRATSSALIRPATAPPPVVAESRRSTRQVPDDLPRRLGAGLAVPRAGVERHALRVANGGRPGAQAGGELADHREGRGGQVAVPVGEPVAQRPGGAAGEGARHDGAGRP